MSECYWDNRVKILTAKTQMRRTVRCPLRNHPRWFIVLKKMISFKYLPSKWIMPIYTLCICWYCQYNGAEIITLNQTSPIKLMIQVVLTVSVSSASLWQCLINANLNCHIVALKICIFSGFREKVNLNTWISTIEAKTERWLNLVLNFIELNLMVSTIVLCGDCFQCFFIKLYNGRSSNSVIVEMVNLRRFEVACQYASAWGFRVQKILFPPSHFCGLLFLFKQFLGIIFNTLP